MCAGGRERGVMYRERGGEARMGKDTSIPARHTCCLTNLTHEAAI